MQTDAAPLDAPRCPLRKNHLSLAAAVATAAQPLMDRAAHVSEVKPPQPPQPHHRMPYIKLPANARSVVCDCDCPWPFEARAWKSSWLEWCMSSPTPEARLLHTPRQPIIIGWSVEDDGVLLIHGAAGYLYARFASRVEAEEWGERFIG